MCMAEYISMASLTSGNGKFLSNLKKLFLSCRPRKQQDMVDSMQVCNPNNKGEWLNLSKKEGVAHIYYALQ